MSAVLSWKAHSNLDLCAQLWQSLLSGSLNKDLVDLKDFFKNYLIVKKQEFLKTIPLPKLSYLGEVAEAISIHFQIF